MTEIALATLVAFVVGFAVARSLGHRARSAQIEAQHRATILEIQLEDERGRAAAASDDIDALTKELRQSAELRAAAEARASERARSAEDRERLLVETEKTLSNAFKALSADALRASNDSFLQLATESLAKFQQQAKSDLEARGKAVETLVQPIRESLQKVDGKLGELERTREGAYASLNEQLRGLVETHLPQLRNETAGLVKALRQPQTRGRWGEMQLQRVVEMAGMLEHCDFVQQPSHESETGRLRPDVIVKLPGGKQIVIDAKAPVAAYLDAVEAGDDAAREVHLTRHAQQVRTHLTALGRKAYWDSIDGPTPEFVVMFLPGESFFSAALQQDPSLIECGVNEKVVLATPTTLIALLRAVAYGWRQEALALNAQEVATLGKQLYERLATLAGKLNDVGEKLGGAVNAYNGAITTIESRVLVSGRKFAELRVANDGKVIAPLAPVEVLPRPIAAPEMQLVSSTALHG